MRIIPEQGFARRKWDRLLLKLDQFPMSFAVGGSAELLMFIFHGK
jgi:hypothetical protein